MPLTGPNIGRTMFEQYLAWVDAGNGTPDDAARVAEWRDALSNLQSVASRFHIDGGANPGSDGEPTPHG